MPTNLSANIPHPDTPIVDPTTGQPAQAWWTLFQQLRGRTGGAIGVDVVTVQTTANTALANAATAQTTADHAQASANTAQTTATAAQTSATAAITAVTTERTRALAAEALLLPKAGVTDGSNAPAGQIGEYISSTVLIAGAVSLTSSAAANVTSIALTDGDWDVWGSVAFNVGASTVATNTYAWTSATGATFPTQPNNGGLGQWLGSYTGGAPITTAGVQRINLSLAATIYLSTYAVFTTSTMSAYGFIGARRVR